jgi:hypothetical protein
VTKDEVIARIRPVGGCVLARVVRIPLTGDIVSGEVIAIGENVPPFLNRRRIQFSERSSPSFTIDGEIFQVVRVNDILDIESP